MADMLITRVNGGYNLEGLELLAANCAFGRLCGAWKHCPAGCCFTFSRVRRQGNTILYLGKKTTTDANNYEWGYRVAKDGTEVEVRVLDSRSQLILGFGGHEPPALAAWEEKGWKVLFQFERPIIGMGEPLPAWCTSAESDISAPVPGLNPAGNGGDEKDTPADD